MSYLDPPRPGAGSLVLASVFPAIVIVLELATGLCAGAFFDPVPTIGHLMLISLVPAVNFLLWRALRTEDAAPRWLMVAGGASIAVAASYSLLFLPMLPFALIAIIFVGIGLLPFAPLAGLIFAARWTNTAARSRSDGLRVAMGGAALGVVALLLVDLPATVTQVALDRYGGRAEDRRSAVTLMRALGDRDMLLRQSYGDTARASGVVSFLFSAWTNGVFWSERPRTDAARELYYRVTGKAFNVVARPGHGAGHRTRLFAWDDDQGGNEVGGRVPSLSLAGSRIDGSVTARDNLAYLEWTIDLANRGDMQREARFTLALPEGAVVSRATLWVDGEPREASIAGRSKTRAAYTRVVSASRDPLLVTTDGAQRLLVQAFPIQPRASMRVRVGVTAPFAIQSNGRRTLALPALVERNFDLDADLCHAVWIEGEGEGARRGTLTDEALMAGRFRLTLPSVMEPSAMIAGVPAQGNAAALAVEQRIKRDAAPRGPLMLVVEASADMAKIPTALRGALDAIAPGHVVGLVVAGDEPAFVAPRPWSREQAARIRAVLAATPFRGGQDGRAALATALRAARADATLLWLHGAQPTRFTSPEPALEQMLDRLPALPRLVRYQAAPGRAMVLTGRPWFDQARLPSPTGDAAADLRDLLSEVTGAAPRWSVSRKPSAGTEGSGSAHVVRLWAVGHLANAGGSRGKEREAAIALAHRLNVVTPVSGAVVLETNRDYKANGLPVPDPDAVPTVPEPETWALLIMTALAGAWLLKRQRGLTGAAA